MRLLLVIFVYLSTFGVTSALAQSDEWLTYFSVPNVPNADLRVYNSHTHQITGFSNFGSGDIIAISPDNTWLAFVRNEATPAKTLWLANTKTGNKIRISSSDGAFSGIWSPDSQQFLFEERPSLLIDRYVTRYNYGDLYLYDVANRIKLSINLNEPALVLDWYSNSNDVLVWNELNGYMKYDTTTGQLSRLTLTQLSNEFVRWSDIAPDKNIMSTISHDDDILIYDLDTQELQKTISHEEFQNVYPVKTSWSPDTKFLAVDLGGNGIVIWNYETDQLAINEISTLDMGFSYQLRWNSPNCLLLIVYKQNPKVSIYKYDMNSGSKEIMYTGNGSITQE